MSSDRIIFLCLAHICAAVSRHSTCSDIVSHPPFSGTSVFSLPATCANWVFWGFSTFLLPEDLVWEVSVSGHMQLLLKYTDTLLFPKTDEHSISELRASCSVVSSSCDMMDCGLPGSSAQGILHTKILVWVALPFPGGSFQPRNQTHVSCISCTGRWVLYHQCHLGSPISEFALPN